MAAQEKSWSETIRRAFGIPDVMSQANLPQIIARKMLDELNEPKPDNAAAEPYSNTIELATRHVAALQAAASSGALDLPLCHYGKVTGPGPNAPLKEEAPVETGVSAIKANLADARGARDPWMRWVFREPQKLGTAPPHLRGWSPLLCQNWPNLTRTPPRPSHGGLLL